MTRKRNAGEYRYPMAGKLQAATGVQLTGNPYEVRSDAGLEGVFFDHDDAKFYASELRGIGATNVKVVKRTRTPMGHSEVETSENPRSPRDSEIAAKSLQEEGEAVRTYTERIKRAQSPELRRALAHARKEERQHAAMFRSLATGNPAGEWWYDSAIIDGMARAIWVTSWADWVGNLSRAERRERGLPSLSGVEISSVAPDTPATAEEAAQDLYVLVQRANGKTPGELFEQACGADGCDFNDENAELFGHYLAMQSMDHGVSWFDDHKEFPLEFPRGFEAHFDGEDLWWSPQVRSRENPRR